MGKQWESMVMDGETNGNGRESNCNGWEAGRNKGKIKIKLLIVNWFLFSHLVDGTVLAGLVTEKAK